jgi:DNA transformation protein
MKDQYAQYVFDMLKPHGSIRAQAMFGGYALYHEGILFALIIEGQVYFKIDDITKPDFERHGAEQFTYQGKHKMVSMPYMTLPESILEDPEELRVWIARACDVSLRAQKTKKPVKKKVAASL